MYCSTGFVESASQCAGHQTRTWIPECQRLNNPQVSRSIRNGRREREGEIEKNKRMTLM